MRKKTIRVRQSGAYIAVYQHTNDRALAELAFFDSDYHNESSLENLRDALGEAAEQIRKWNGRKAVKR